MFVVYFEYGYCAMMSGKYQTFSNNGINEVSHPCMKTVGMCNMPAIWSNHLTPLYFWDLTSEEQLKLKD